MGRLIDIDRLCNDLAKRWSIADKKKEDLIRAVMADVVTPIVVSQPTVDAIPVEWIEIEIEWFKNADNAFVTLTAGQLSAMLRRWKDGDHHEG